MQLVRFLIVGALNSAIGLAIIWFAMAAGVTNAAANAIGYAVGVIVSFALNRRFTFAHRGDWRPALLRWLAVFAVAWPANLIVMLLAVRAGVEPHLAQLAGVATYTVLSYLGARRFAFA